MNTRTRREILKAYITIDTVATLILSIVVLWFNLPAGLICLLCSGGLFAYHRYVTEKRLIKKLNEYKENIIRDREDLMSAFSNGSPLMLCVVDRVGRVHWTNNAYDACFATRADMEAVFPKEKIGALYENENLRLQVRSGEKIYEVSAVSLGGSNASFRLLFWEDITDGEGLKASFRESRVCMAYLGVDNYDEIISETSIENRSKAAAQIDEVIFGWAKEIGGAVYRISESRYSIIFQQKYLDKLKESGFPILNKMHGISTEADFPTSVSIGIGVGDLGFAQLQNSAEEAIDLALGRGGDQAVIRDKGGETEYFGGSLPAVAKRNKGRSRVMAHALSNLMDDADKVLVLGHTRPDMDSFGASVGIYALASNKGKEVHIVLENPGDGIDIIWRTACSLRGDDGEPAYSFVNHAQAKSLLTKNTLVVAVDHHLVSLSEDPALLSDADKIAVIDHHRRSSDAIEKPVLSHMESYASSASELVTELLQYSGENGEISRFEAEALLSGIVLDTKNFTVNAGVRTFEAASWLKRNGADGANINNYFRIDLNFYQKKVNVIANAEILPNGVAVAYTKDKDPAMQVIVSQAADELLTMKGVEASVAAGRGDSRTMVSARSNGKYNVQTLMEKLGGGGHQLAAAVQLDVGPEEAIAQVVQAMRLEGIL